MLLALTVGFGASSFISTDGRRDHIRGAPLDLKPLEWQGTTHSDGSANQLSLSWPTLTALP